MIEATEPISVNRNAASDDSALEHGVGRRILSNSIAQLIGRFAVAGTRFIMVAAIIRSGGKELFAQYSIVLGMLTLGEWLVDFGTTDAFTREICREPEQSGKLLRTLTVLKSVQFPVAVAILGSILLLFRYPRPVVQAGLVGALSLFWFCGVLIYRVVFRSQMRVERDVMAEFLSVIVLVPTTLLICRYRLGLVAIFWAYFFSRFVFFECVAFLGRDSYRLSLQGVDTSDFKWGAKTSFAIGLAGFLAVGYETTDILMLSRFGTVSDTALYSAAQKLVTPVMMALAAVASTFYPLFARFWPKHRQRFAHTAQRALNIVLLLAGFCIAPLITGADFFMRLLAKQMSEGLPALKGMAVLCFLKTVTLTLGPILYIVFAQRQLLKMVAVALIIKALCIWLLAPRFGYLAVIGTSICLEVVFSTVTVIMIRHFTGWRVLWAEPARIAIALSIAVLIPSIVHLHGIAAAGTGVALYTAIVSAMGLIRIAELRQLLSQKQPVLSEA